MKDAKVCTSQYNTNIHVLLKRQEKKLKNRRDMLTDNRRQITWLACSGGDLTNVV